MENLVQYHRITDEPGLILGDALYKEFSFNRHYHLDYHIGLISEGVHCQHIQGKKSFIGPGVLSVVSPEEIHEGMGQDGNEFSLKTFRISHELLTTYFIDVFDTDKGMEFHGTAVSDITIWNKLAHIHHTLITYQTLSYPHIEGCWIEFLTQLFSHVKIGKSQADSGTFSNYNKKQIQEYCIANLSEKISLTHLAGLCGLSRYQFLRRFKKSTGITPHNWLTQLRLERACALLKKGDTTIANIATDVGFYDQSHFVRAFKASYGVPPSLF